MDEHGEVPAGQGELGDHDQLLYDLEGWEDDERAELGAALAAAALPFEWSGTTLVVRRRDEVAVEQVLDDVDEALDLALDEDQPRVAYDLGEWDDDRRAQLAVLLADGGIPHAWSGDELVVHEEDEQVVDDLLDRVGHEGAGVAGDGAGGGAGGELLGELFVAADRLLHDPHDHEGTLSLVDALRLAEASEAPYGVDERQWTAIVGRARDVARLVEAGPVDEDAVIDAATALRQALRPLV